MNVRQFAGPVKRKLRQNAVHIKLLTTMGLCLPYVRVFLCGGSGSIPFHEAAVYLFEHRRGVLVFALSTTENSLRLSQRTSFAANHAQTRPIIANN